MTTSRTRHAIASHGHNAVCTLIAISLGLAAGFTAAASAQALPDSTLRKRLTQTGTVSHVWTAPGTGAIQAHSGDVWVTGTGSLLTPGDHRYNGWATSWADKLFVGEIVNVDEGFWILDRASCGYRLKAEAVFVWSSYLGVFEPYRAETTATAEIRGISPSSLSTAGVVDNYTRPGTTQYYATGGGAPPIVYANGGSCTVKRGPGAHGFDGRERLDLTVRGATGPVLHDDKLVVFWLYARGKQYMHNAAEEDVSLTTSIEGALSGYNGWAGQLISYERVPGGPPREIRRHDLP